MRMVAPEPPMFWAMPTCACASWLRPASPAQLLHDLDDLIDAGGADRMAACLQAAHGRDRQAPAQGDGPGRAQLDAAPALGKAAGLQRQHRHDAEGVVQLEKIDVVGSEAAWAKARRLER